MPAATGEPLDMALGWRFDGNGHLTAGRTIPGQSQPGYMLSSLGRSLFALDGAGQVRWRSRLAGPVYALAVLEGGQVAAGDDGGRVTMLNPVGGTLWQHELGSRVTSVQPFPDGGLLAGGWDERLTLFDDKGGVQWQAALGGPLSSVTWLSLPGGQALAAASTLEGQILAFDAGGAEIWRLDVGSPVAALGNVQTTTQAWLVAGLQDGRLLLLDANGALVWHRSVGRGAPVWHLAAVDDDPGPELVVGSGGDEPLLAMLSLSGQVYWRTKVPAAVGGLAVVDVDGDGSREILAGLGDGQVQAYDAAGRLRSSVHAGLPVWDLVDAGDGSVLALADVVAWRIAAGPGPAGGPWLPPPALLPQPAPPLPQALAQREGEGVLIFLGDVAPGRSMEQQLVRYGPEYPWQGLASLLGLGDEQRDNVIAVANLEAVLTRQGRPLDKPYVIRAHPLWGQMVAQGLDLVSLANNHALDYGPEGLDETISTLETLSVAVAGAGNSAEEARRPRVLSANGVRVALLAYAAARWNGSVDVPATERLAWALPAVVQADVAAVRQEADVVVVLLHAGTEYASQPAADQVAFARAAVDAGADLVVGHHPHVTQTVERYGHGLIVYSLGDAVFDIPRPAAMRGDLLRVHVDQSGLTQAELWPFWIKDAICPWLLDDGTGAAVVRLIYP